MSDAPTHLDELRTPLQIVNRMEWVIFYLRKATKAIGDPEDGLRQQFITAKDAYSKAFKTAKAQKTGTVGDREDQAQLEHWDLWVAMNGAEAVLQYAKEKKADLQDELSKLQSESGLIKKEMELAGRIS